MTLTEFFYMIRARLTADSQLYHALQESRNSPAEHYINLATVACDKHYLPLAVDALASYETLPQSEKTFKKYNSPYHPLVKNILVSALEKEHYSLADTLLSMQDLSSKPREKLLRATFFSMAKNNKRPSLQWFYEHHIRQRMEAPEMVGRALALSAQHHNEDNFNYLIALDFHIGPESYAIIASPKCRSQWECILKVAASGYGKIAFSVCNMVLIDAAKAGDEALVNRALAVGAEIPKRDPQCRFASESIREKLRALYQDQRFFSDAAAMGDIRLVGLGLKAGISPILWNNEPLYRAARGGHTAVLIQLKQHMQSPFPSDLALFATHTTDDHIIGYLSRNQVPCNLPKIFSARLAKGNVASAALLIPLMTVEDINHPLVQTSLYHQLRQNPDFLADFPLFPRAPHWLDSEQTLEAMITGGRADIMHRCQQQGLIAKNDDALLMAAIASHDDRILAMVCAVVKNIPASLYTKNAANISDYFNRAEALKNAAAIGDTTVIIELTKTGEYLPTLTDSLHLALSNGHETIAATLFKQVTHHIADFKIDDELLCATRSEKTLFMLMEHMKSKSLFNVFILRKVFNVLLTKNNIAMAKIVLSLMPKKDFSSVDVQHSIELQIQKNPDFPVDFPIFSKNTTKPEMARMTEAMVVGGRADMIFYNRQHHFDYLVYIDDHSMIRAAYNSGKRSMLAMALKLSTQPYYPNRPPYPSPEIEDYFGQAYALKTAVKTNNPAELNTILNTGEYLPTLKESLSLAVTMGHETMAHTLLKHIIVHIPDFTPNFDMLKAARSENMLLTLLERGGKDNDQHHLLLSAIEKHFSQVVTILADESIDWKKDLFTTHCKKMINNGNRKAVRFYCTVPVNKDGAMLNAAKLGNAEITSLLVGEKSNTANDNSAVALIAAKQGWCFVLERLLKGKHIAANSFQTLTTIYKRRLIIDILLEHGVTVGGIITPAVRAQLSLGKPPNQHFAPQHLVDAAACGIMPVVKHIVHIMTFSHTPEIRKEWLDKAVEQSATYDRGESTLVLIDHGASIDKALIAAVKNDHKLLVNHLLARPLDLTAENAAAVTHAVKRGQITILRALLRASVEPPHRPIDGTVLLAMVPEKRPALKKLVTHYKQWQDLPANDPQKDAMKRLWEVNERHLTATEWENRPVDVKQAIPVQHVKRLQLTGAITILEKIGLTKGIPHQIAHYVHYKDAVNVSRVSNTAYANANAYTQQHRPGALAFVKEAYSTKNRAR